MTAIFWFRQDLRLSDNPALTKACNAHDDVIYLYILDENAQRPLGGAQRWWLHHSLTSLAESLKKKSAVLTLCSGKADDVLAKLANQHKVEAVYWNRVFTPYQQHCDDKIQQKLERNGIEVTIYHDHLLLDPDDVKNKSGGYFKVYTPFSKNMKKMVTEVEVLNAPRKCPQKSHVKMDNLSDWQLLPTKPDWSEGFSHWTVGEAAAKRKLLAFTKEPIKHYADERDRPDWQSTSQLSPHIHFGEISIRQAWEVVKNTEAQQPGYQKGIDVFTNQLLWREFSYYLLHYFPDLQTKNYRSDFDKFRWCKSKKLLRAWQKGQTGYPMVDAGMRQLWQTGFMHNRLRMITASFLTKHCLIHWTEGEKWFWDTLVDADTANNSAGWQWVAGCGADAAPYFRIFNPIIQGSKFDPNGDYIRQWCPELAKLPNKYLFFPADAPESVLKEAGVTIGKEYPAPVVNHADARAEAMLRYRALK